MSNWRKYKSLLQVLRKKVNCEDIGMKIQHSTGPASCKVNFNAGDHMQNTPLTPKKVVKLTAKPELSDTYRICKRSDCRIPGPGVGVFEEREILQWTLSGTLLLFNVCGRLRDEKQVRFH